MKYYRIEIQNNKIFVDGEQIKLKKGQFMRWYVQSQDNPFDELNTLKTND